MHNQTVFVIEDDAAVSTSLRYLFDTISLKVEFFSNAKSYLEVSNPLHHGCLLIDIRLPDMNGLKLLELLVERKNQIPIIMMTGHGDINTAVRAMKLGAKDFILKPFNEDYLLEQVQKILSESSEKQKNYQFSSACLDQLTRRELETLKLIVAGKSNKEIAKELNITLSTVEQHRAHLMQKMQVKSVAQLVKNYLLVMQ